MREVNWETVRGFSGGLAAGEAGSAVGFMPFKFCWKSQKLLPAAMVGSVVVKQGVGHGWTRLASEPAKRIWPVRDRCFVRLCGRFLTEFSGRSLRMSATPKVGATWINNVVQRSRPG